MQCMYSIKTYIFCHLPGEFSDDMETSSDSTTSPLETTKDTCNLEVKQTFEETGMAASTCKISRHVLHLVLLYYNSILYP